MTALSAGKPFFSFTIIYLLFIIFIYLLLYRRIGTWLICSLFVVCQLSAAKTTTDFPTLSALLARPFDYAPTYLRDVVVPLWTMPGRAHLRSADSGQYDVPRVSTLADPRAFPVAGPLAWNQLPASLRNMNCIATFKRHLKTILFKAAYGVADN